MTLEATRPPPPPVLSPPPAPHITPWLDPEHFRLVFRQLAMYTEQLEGLNDQILEAMTLYRPPPPRPSRLSSFLSSGGEKRKTGSADNGTDEEGGSGDGSGSGDDQDRIERGEKSPSPTPEEKRRMKGKEKAPVNLEEERQMIAQAFTDLTMECWPRIYKIPAEPRTEQATKDRIKIATQLKDAIVAFWSVQSHFQERAQLLLDIYQVPIVWARDGWINVLDGKGIGGTMS